MAHAMGAADAKGQATGRVPPLFPGVQLHASAQHIARFWTSFIRLGFCILGAQSLAVLGYLILTPRGDHRATLEDIASSALAVAFGGVLAAPWIGRKSWRVSFNFLMTLSSGVVVALFCLLDGGIDSPVVYLVVLPVISASLVFSVRLVTVCAAAAVAELIAIAIIDSNITSELGLIVLICSFVAGICLFALFATRARVRLVDEDDRIHIELAHRAETDTLTGCLNHGAFYRRLEGEISRFDRYGTVASLVMVDIDLFKTFNDAHGHQAGDAVLAAVGSQIVASARRSDMVARIGGDEFAIILPSTSLGVAYEVACRLLHDIQERSEIGVTCSMGVASLDQLEPTPTRLVRDADEALYQAKIEGRDRVVASSGSRRTVFGPRSEGSIRTTSEDRDLMEQKIRQAERRNSETIALMDAMFDASPIGLCFIDHDFRTLRINSVLAEVNGVPVEDQIGRRVPDVVPPALWKQLEPIYQSVIESGKAIVVDDVVTESPEGSGEMRYWHSTFYPVRLEGDITGIGIAAVDLTDRRELEESEQRLVQSVVAALASTVEIRDPYTSGHQASVALLASAIGAELNLDSKTVSNIELAARIHDVGKVRIPAEILARPGRLTESELAVVREHAQFGADILASCDFSEAIREMVHQHHERLNGSGYPRGLSGDQISLGARVIAVADVVDSMASARPYRQALGIDAALDEILSKRGDLYDPKVVDACVRVIRGGHLSATPSPIPRVSGR